MDYNKLTKKELVKICKDKNIIGIGNKNKLKIIELLKNYKDKDINIRNENINPIKNTEEYLEIVESEKQTKEWRSKCDWYKNGKSNECEVYQKKILKQLIGFEPSKCKDRINMETLEIIKKANPLVNIDGFEYTEDFDGKIIKDNTKFYFNLKFCCDIGGAQTRTLRLVYEFIKYQIKYLVVLQNQGMLQNKPYYFINILDGDTCNNNMDKFMYLLQSREGYINNDILDIIKKYIFIGDMLKFSKSEMLPLLIN
jgi:hypothetical protein